MLAVQVQHYRNRARDFHQAMDLLKDDLQSYQYASALVAIHGSISYADALRIGLGGTQLSSDDHRSATDELRGLLQSRRYEKFEGLSRLTRLLSHKSAVAYGSRPVHETQVKSIVEQAQRFAVWAEKTGKELQIEGW